MPLIEQINLFLAMKFIIFTLTLLLMNMVFSHATEVIAAWEADNESNSLDASVKAHAVQSATIERGHDLVADTSFTGFYDSIDWSAAIDFPGINDGNYLSIQILLEPDWVVTLTQISLVYSDAGSRLGPRTFELRYSGDNFNSVLFRDNDVSVFPEEDLNVIGLSGTSQQSGLLEFRLWGYDSPGSFTGSADAVAGLSNNSMLLINEEPAAVVIEGTLTEIPEPANFTFWLAIAALYLVVTRKFRTFVVGSR